MTKDHLYILEIIKSGDPSQLEELSELEESFPQGSDSYIGIRWITHAIDLASLKTIQWMLKKKVNLLYQSEDGFPALHSMIYLEKENKYAILETLLKAGADVNLKGINDWAPAHAAAARNDVTALKILVKYHADLTVKTQIDQYATPLEEARILNKHANCCNDAILYLEHIVK